MVSRRLSEDARIVSLRFLGHEKKNEWFFFNYTDIFLPFSLAGYKETIKDFNLQAAIFFNSFSFVKQFHFYRAAFWENHSVNVYHNFYDLNRFHASTSGLRFSQIKRSPYAAYHLQIESKTLFSHALKSAHKPKTVPPKCAAWSNKRQPSNNPAASSATMPKMACED